MADNDFDRTVIQPLEKPLSSDINQESSQRDRTLRGLLRMIFAGNSAFGAGIDGLALPMSGFIGDSFKVRPTPIESMVVTVAYGYGFIVNFGDLPTNIGSIQGVNDLEAYKPLVLESGVSFTVPGNSSGATRYDIIEVKYDRRLENPLTRQILNPTTQLFSPTTVDKTLAFYNDGRTGMVTAPASSTQDISYKVGGATRPAVTSGYIKIADLVIPNGAATIGRSCIGDERNILSPGNRINVDVVLSVAKTNPCKPSILSVQAPPGVEVYANGNFGTAVSPEGASAELLILAGQPSQLVTATVTCDFNGDEQPIPEATGATVKRASSAYQTEFADASYTAPNARAVHIGVGFVSVPLGANAMTTSEDAVYRVRVTLSPQMITPPAYP